MSGESTDVSIESVNEWFKSIPELIQDYKMKNIFNMDEVALVYQKKH